MAAAGLLVRLGQVGGPDGIEWDEGHIGTPKEILISHNYSGIASIQFIYEQQDGTNVLAAKHGGDGQEFTSIQLSGPITMISGSHDCVNNSFTRWKDLHVIRSLRFATRDATYGPFGNTRELNDYDDTFKFEHNGGIVGFHGRSDDLYLCALGVYIQTTAQKLVGSSSSSLIPVKKEHY